MTLQSVTLRLPDSLIHQARQAAASKHQTVEEVLVEWIQPPRLPRPYEDLAGTEDIEALSGLSDEVLLGIARSPLPAAKIRRLAALIEVQQEQRLTDAERHEALRLVEEEDRLTLRKARALHLLKQRGALPPELVPHL